MGLYGNHTRNVQIATSWYPCKHFTAQRFHRYGYYQVKCTPVLWQHVWRPISFTLVVDYIGIVYVEQDNPDHLMSALKTFYENITTYLKKHYTVV